MIKSGIFLANNLCNSRKIFLCKIRILGGAKPRNACRNLSRDWREIVTSYVNIHCH
jgi:hypothetical protein